MAQYTVLTDTKVNEITQHYALGKVVSYKILDGGSENSNYLITTPKSQFVLTICEQQTQQQALNLALLLQHLAINDFSTSQIIANNSNELVTVWNNKPILMKHYLTGLVIGDLSTPLLSYLGKELAQLHTITAPKFLSNSLSYGIEAFEQIHKYAARSAFAIWLKKITGIIKPQLSLDLPRSLIHGDLFSNNVVISHDKRRATIMDLEEARYYYRIYDIGMSIVGLCSDKETIDLTKVQFFLEGYQQENVLLNLELNSLKTFTLYAATSIAFWRHKHFNYIEPQKSMFNHYLVMKNLADNIIELPQDCFQFPYKSQSI